MKTTSNAPAEAVARGTSGDLELESRSPIVELADRHSNDLDVALFWGRRSGRLWVLVKHRRSGRTARIDATTSNALDVFNHPFAYGRELA
jgi:hypothetical protein